MKPIYQTIIKAILRDRGIDADPEKVESLMEEWNKSMLGDFGDLSMKRAIVDCLDAGHEVEMETRLSLESKST